MKVNLMRSDLLNRVLENSARELYEDDIHAMAKLSPEMIARKISSANVQQAFVMRTVLDITDKNKKKDSRLLAAGSYDDTACDSLQKLGYFVQEVDPDVNQLTLHEFKTRYPDERYDIAFSTSVIEHVENDTQFFEDLMDMSEKYIVMTFDYKPDWKPGERVCTTNYRFYTPSDIQRMKDQFAQNGWFLFGKEDYNGDIDFEWEGIPYAFATMVLKKGN